MSIANLLGSPDKQHYYPTVTPSTVYPVNSVPKPKHTLISYAKWRACVCFYMCVCVCVSMASDARLSYIISSVARVVSGGLIHLIDGIGTGKNATSCKSLVKVEIQEANAIDGYTGLRVSCILSVKTTFLLKLKNKQGGIRRRIIPSKFNWISYAGGIYSLRAPLMLLAGLKYATITALSESSLKAKPEKMSIIHES